MRLLRGPVIVVAVVAAMLSSSAGAQEAESSEPALAPSSVVPEPRSLSQATGNPDALRPVPVSHLDEEETPPFIGHHEFTASFTGLPVWVPEVERAYVMMDGLLVVLDADGSLLTTSRIPPGDNWGGVSYAFGSLFLAGESRLVEIDPVTLARRGLWTVADGSAFVTGFAVTTDEILVARFDGTFTRIDRSDDSQSDAGSISGFSGIRHHPSWGQFFLSADGSGITRYDGTQSPPAAVGSLPGETIVDIGDDGTILTRADSGDVVNRRSASDFSLLSTTTVGPGGFQAEVRLASDAGVLLSRGPDAQIVELFAEGGGRIAAMPVPSPRVLIEPTSGATEVFMVVGNSTSQVNAWVATTRPFPTGVSHPLLRPSWAPSLIVEGWGLGGTTAVTVDGRSVPFEVLDPAADMPSLLLDVSALPDPTDDATIRITGPNATGSTTVPATVPRGSAALSIRTVVIGGDAPAVEEYAVTCESAHREASARAGQVAIVLVPALESCTVASGTSAADVRSGFVDLDRPGGFADVFGSRAPFFSGGSRHAQFVRNANPSSNPVWLFTAPVGDAPTDVVYPFDITCGSWSRRYNVPSGFGVRVELPLTVPSTRCNARLARLRGAENVISHLIVRDEIVRTSGRDREFFPTQTRGRYLTFVIDHGGADITVPVAVGAPREDIGDRANVGVVHIFPTSADGRLRGGDEQTLRQGRAGISGKGERHDRFGEVIKEGDFDADGFLDFAIGVPGEDLGSKKNAGLVTIVYGNRNGYRSGRTQTLHQDVAGVPRASGRADRFGAALAAVDFDGDGFTDLAVGVPGQDVNGVKNAGIVQIFFGSPGGLTTDRVEELSQATPGFADEPERNDKFGTALAGAGSMLAIGVPFEDFGSKANAGMIHLVDGLTGQEIWDRQGRTTGDRAEAKDRFGSVLVMDDDRSLAVGVPLEDLGSRTNAGIIHTYRFIRPASATDGLLSWETASTRAKENLVGSRSSAGDRFGSSLVYIDIRADINEGIAGLSWLIVGAPEANVSGRTDAGEIVARAVIDGRVFLGVIDQSDGFPGSPASGAQLGASMSWGPWGSLIVGMPGARVDGKADAGRVYATTDLGDWFGVDQDTRGVGTRSEAGAGFGAELG